MSSVFKSHTDFPLYGVLHVLDDNDPNGSLGTSENESVSTNGSCAGEMAEDPTSCKVTRYVPGLEAAPNKQEKNRLKNERKHQRQKERKGKELKERCHGLLMNRKLEKLVDKLVSMGFLRKRASIALRMNEGNVERSINFLVEDGRVSAEEAHAKLLKVDISEEISRMADLEDKLGYSGFEVQRAVVACEGDIDHAIKWLREHSPGATPEQQRRASPTTPPPMSMATSYSSAPPAPNYPAEHLTSHYRESGITSAPANYRREPVVNNYREPPGVVNSTPPRRPAHTFPGVNSGESSPGGGSLPLGMTFQEPPRTSPLPRTQHSANAPFELPAWTMREIPPRRNVYTDWRNSHPVNHPSMNRLEETGSLMRELYLSPQKPRTPSFDHSQNVQWPELYDRARVSSPFQELHDRQVSPGIYNSRAPPSPFPGLYDRTQRGTVISPIGLRNTARTDDGWNVERLKSVDYKSIDWSMDGKLNPVSLGWSGETRPFSSKDILPTVL